MSDLGLNGLTDDQLVDLLNQVLTELTMRNHYVRSATQDAIFTHAQKLEALKKAATAAVRTCREEYTRQIEQEILDDIKEQFQAGKIRLFTPEEEARLIAEADQMYRSQLAEADTAQKALQLASTWVEHAKRTAEQFATKQYLRKRAGKPTMTSGDPVPPRRH